MRRVPKIIFVVVGVLGCWGAGRVPAQEKAAWARPEVRAAEPVVRGPYLQFSSAHLMHVVWRTAGPVTPVVRYGRRMDDLKGVVPANAIVTRVSLGTEKEPGPEKWQGLRTVVNRGLPQLHSAPVGTFQYEAILDGLEAGTRYYYAVFDGERRLTAADPSYSFVTAPPVGTRGPVRFGVLGDSGTGREAQWEVAHAMTTYAWQTSRDLDFWIHVGDMAYGVGRDMEFQTRMFGVYEELMRRTVCWPTMGNHEGMTSKGTTGIGPYYDAFVVPTRGEAGGLASGTEAYYSFDHANIHFICLDSHDLDRTPSGAMAKWLKADLERAKAEWIIAFWHHPPYTKGSHDSDKEKDLIEMREHIMPIAEAGGVDLVLTGHSHIYERSMLMDGAYATPTVSENVILDDGDGDPDGDGAYRKSEGIHPHRGTVQVVAGHSGANLGRVGSLPVMKRIIVEHGSVVVDVEGETLTARMLNKHGVVRDQFSMVKRGTVPVSRLGVPWRPAAYEKPANAPGTPAMPAVYHTVAVDRGAVWQYRVDDLPRGRGWTRPEFDASGWRVAPAGFGYGDVEVSTRLPVPAGTAPRVYLRREFTVEQADAVTEVGLWVNYTAGFIAYLNGEEVARVNVGRSSGRNVQEVKARTERSRSYLALKNGHLRLKDGRNVITLEAHGNVGDADFAIDPVVILED